MPPAVSTPASLSDAKPTRGRTMRPVSRAADNAFRWLCLAMVLFVGLLVVLIGWNLWRGSQTVWVRYGFSFLTSSEWNPVTAEYGVLPFILGTVVSAVLGLLIATPLAILTALYLTELAPVWLRAPLTALVEMIAAVPSVILGLWGIFVMIPWLRDYVVPVLQKFFGWTPFFSGTFAGRSMLAAAIIIAVMVLPIITSVTREILRSVPDLQREAAYGLGATRWEVTRIAVLSYAKAGIFGAVILGLGRALGETMAVTMVIGNAGSIATSLLKPSDTLASKIANNFAGADPDQIPALIAAGFVLFVVTILVNIVARLLVGTMTKTAA